MVDEKRVEITSLQYRQLDFLRLFRLCKNLEVFSRKRKMPTEYVSNDIEKNDKNAKSACRRLLRALIIKLFPDFNIKSNSISYYLEPPAEIKQVLIYINNHTRNERELEDINNAYAEICNPLGGFIFPRLPYTINIRFFPVYDTRNGFMHKPKESFYKCGLSCVAYKRGLWDVLYELLMSAPDEHKKIMEKRRIERSKVAVPLPSSTFTLDDGFFTRSLTALSEVITASRERANTVNPQESFDRALQNMLSRRDNDE